MRYLHSLTAEPRLCVYTLVVECERFAGTSAAMAQTKATKKFEKHHLKGALDRRNGLKKTKQKQQLKQRKKARRAEENGRDVGAYEERKSAIERKTNGAEALQSMSVDDFFQGGFEIPELPKNKTSSKKRRRDAEEDASDSDSDDSLQQEPVVTNGEVSEDESDDGDHQAQLDALAANDPEFHKYLEENEPELLKGKLAEIDNIELEEQDEEGEDSPRRKRQKTDSDSEEEVDTKSDLNAVTVQKWTSAMKEQHSLRAAREVVLAFRAAVHGSDDEDKSFKYSISDPDVYHQLLTSALRNLPTVFQHHLPVQEVKGKTRVPTDSKKFKSITPLLKSLLTSIIQLLDTLSDPATLRLTLSSTLPLLPYILSLKKLVRDLCKAVTSAWSSSSNTEAVRIAAFLVLRRLVVIGDPSIRENVLKSAYQGLIKSSRNTTVHSIAGINLMKNSAAELWGIDLSVGYTTGFTFIRQLAIHLRSCITNNSNESYKAVYNWQYTHSLDFWSRVLAAHCTTKESALQPLIFPLVQVTLGALRLIPTATYFPLRFQLVRSLLRISHSTSTYIPLASSLYEVLASAEMRKAPKPSTIKPLDFDTAIRVPKSYLRTRVYQDGVAEQVQELFAEFFGLWAKNIAFPELALAVVVMLKRWLKDVSNRGGGNKNQKVNGMISLLIQKIEANSRLIEEKRAKVDFAPNNRKEVDNFLHDLEWEKTPIGAFLVGYRRTKAEKAKLVEEARAQESRREKDDRAEDDEVESDEAASDDEMEMSSDGE